MNDHTPLRSEYHFGQRRLAEFSRLFKVAAILPGHPEARTVFFVTVYVRRIALVSVPRIPMGGSTIVFRERESPDNPSDRERVRVRETSDNFASTRGLGCQSIYERFGFLDDDDLFRETFFSVSRKSSARIARYLLRRSKFANFASVRLSDARRRSVSHVGFVGERIRNRVILLRLPQSQM